jgi:hypothetical protein
VAKIELTPTELIVHVAGLDKLWSLRSQLRIPLDHVRDVTLDTEIARAGPQRVRLLGTYIPGVVAAGTFGLPGKELVFWDVHNPEEAIVIYLDHEHYAGLVVEVDDPQAAASNIINAIARQPHRDPG